MEKNICTQNYYATVWNSVIKYNLQLGNKATQNTTVVWYSSITAVRGRHDKFKLESEKVPEVWCD